VSTSADDEVTLREKRREIERTNGWGGSLFFLGGGEWEEDKDRKMRQEERKLYDYVYFCGDMVFGKDCSCLQLPW
jgi:hypothetical protein